MKSLKRTLCLVLAMVMVLGFFGIASAESFKDDDTIQYKEAVGVMTGIGSINGMGDNTFAPTGKVTRAQAAKMVAYAVLGADVAKTLPASTSRFTDVDSNFAWAIPSIEYLANAGVINGRGNGTFDPNGEVTGYEIAKMLLCAAGYGKNGEFTGNSWALNVAIAEKNRVFTGTKAADRNAAATREECALYCFNGITSVGQVEWNKTTEAYGTPGATIAAEVYGYTGKVGDTTHGYVYQVTKVEQDVVKTSATYGKLLATAETLKDGTALGYKFVVDSFDAVGNCFNLYVGTVNTETVVYSAVQLTNEVAAPVGAAAQAAFTKTYNLAAQTAPLFENYAKGANVAVSTYTNWTSSAVVIPDTDKDGYDEIVAVKSDAYTIEVLSATANSKGQYVATLNGVTVADETAATPYNYIATDIDFSKYTDGGLVQVYKYLAYGATDLYKVAETSFTLGVPVKIDTNGTYTMKDGKTLAATSTTHNAGIIDPAILSKGYTVSTPALQSATATNPTTYVFFLDANGNYFAAAEYEGTVESSAYYATYTYAATGDYGTTVYKVQAVDATGALQTFTVADKVAADAINPDVADAYPSAVNASYKVTVNAATGIATFVALDADYNAAVVNANAIAKNEVLLDTVAAKNCYMNENTKFVFVPATGAPAFTGANAIVVKTGVDEVVGQTISADSLMYYAKTTSANKTVSTVIVNHAFNPAVANDATGVIFVPADASKTASVSGANYYNVYIDGVKTSLLVSAADDILAAEKIPAGWYTYVTTSGVADLTLYDNAASTTIDAIALPGEAITNYYSGLFSTTTTFTNKSFEGATVVDLRAEVAAGTSTAVTTTSGLASLVAAATTDGKTVTITASYNQTTTLPTVVYILSVA